MLVENLSKLSLANGGSITPLIISSKDSEGLGLTNPSIWISPEDGRYRLILRNVSYLFYHSEGRQRHQCKWGPLSYLHPENDQALRTTNFICELDPNTLEIIDWKKVDTTELDIPPVWEFIGLEDARLVEWDGKTILTGVRRDTKPNGEGRMEVSFINEDGKETYRSRIQPPNNKPSYCEKNWMPIEGKPWHYVKWTNPTEVVKISHETQSSETTFLGKPSKIKFPRDLRGSSHVVKYKDYYVALTHEVDLWFNEKENKDSQYYHRFIVWNKDWEIVYHSDIFKFMTGSVEFTCGMAFDGENFILPFGFQDSTAFILRMPSSVFETIVGMPTAPKIKDTMKITSKSTLIEKYIDSPFDEDLSFELAEYYYGKGHFASALSFYLRTAEYGRNKNLIYDSLYMIANCIATSGNRDEAELAAWNEVVSFDPTRPEGYIKLSLYYESRKRWDEAYMSIMVGKEFIKNASPKSAYLKYLGEDQFKFQEAVLSWWVGKFTQSREAFLYLFKYRFDKLPIQHQSLILSNLTWLGINVPITEPYRKGLHKYLRLKFKGSDKIDRNYSQAYQDMFVLTATNGKKKGRYFEIGSADPIKHNNTYLLEKDFDWEGISLDILEDEVNKFNQIRKNKAICTDALNYDYENLMEGHYDYLQLDIDPAVNTYNILLKIPFNKCTFGVITYEHDDYLRKKNFPPSQNTDNTPYNELAYQHLTKLGYVRIAENIGVNNQYNFEDWYVHPNFIDIERLKPLMKNNSSIIYSVDYMLDKQ